MPDKEPAPLEPKNGAAARPEDGPQDDVSQDPDEAYESEVPADGNG